MMTTACACGSGTCGGICAPPPDDEGVAPASRFAQGALRDRLVAALGRERALDGLGTRDPADPALALVDAWTGALHVLAFSAARLAEDGDLALASDRGAMLELTRLVGYSPRPAIAASTLMALTVDSNATTDPLVPAGTQIATVPRDKELPLTFETSADLVARGAWNTLRPARTTDVQKVEAATTELLVAGIDVQATLGDAILARIDDATLLLARFVAVQRRPELTPPQALLTVTAGVTLASTFGPALGEVAVLGVRTSAFGALAPDYGLVKQGTGNAEAVRLLSVPVAIGAPAPGTISEARLQAALTLLAAGEWPHLTMPTDGTVDLSSVVKEALPGRIALFVADALRQAGRIATTSEAFRAGFALSGAATRITLEGVTTKPVVTPGNESFNERVRETAIHIETQRLRLLALPDPTEILPLATSPDRLTVAGEVTLPAGRLVALVGIDASTGVRRVEAATVIEAVASGRTTSLTLEAPLKTRFFAEGLTIVGNVVGATHGRTPPNQPELLGSADARRPAPVYPLSAGPVTHVADTSARGYTPAIAVRVGGRLYERVEAFLDLADERAWRLRQRRDGGFEVQFAGRLPTATNSVTATYRVGGGAAGNVDPGRITMLMTPVLGIARAENLTAAEGGTDAAGPDDMRRAGDSVAMLERVVSLADYERFARAFRGVGKARATELREAMRQTVYLTVAGADGRPPSTGLVQDLGAALAKVSIPGRRVRVVGFVEARIPVTVAFAQDPALIRSDVAIAVRAALLAAFGAQMRNFGQSLYASEVLAATQGVPGVLAATVTLAGGADPVIARPPRLVGGTLALASLVSVGTDTLTLTGMEP